MTSNSEEETMMGTRSSFFSQVYLRNAARQRQREERDLIGISQSLPLQSQEPELSRKASPEGGPVKATKDAVA